MMITLDLPETTVELMIKLLRATGTPDYTTLIRDALAALTVEIGRKPTTDIANDTKEDMQG